MEQGKKEYHTCIQAIEWIDQYQSKRITTEHLPEIFEDGLVLFMKFPHAVSAALFLLNDLTYEFEHKKSLPEKYSEQNISSFTYLVDNGTIGLSLESGKVSKFSGMTEENIQNFYIFPLIVSTSGVIGLVLLEIEKFLNEEEASILVKTFSLHASLFAGLLENTFLFKNLYKTQTLLEQKVAARTMTLTQSKRELQMILDSVQTGILVIDEVSNKIINANPVASQMIGLPQVAIVDRLADSFLPKLKVLQEAIKTKKSNYESLLIDSSNNKTAVLRSTSSIYLGNQKLRIESFLDISERKKAEMALTEANQLLELKVKERTLDLQLLVHKLKVEVSEREKAEQEIRKMLEKEKELGDLKTRFISMVSHEFRTPMTIIRSAAQMIIKFKDKLSEEEKERDLNKILVTVDSMTDLLENVLFIGKTDSEKLNFKPQFVDIELFCSEIIKDLLLSMDNEREIRYSHNCETKEAYVDAKLLRHILFNLLSNALKYSDKDKPVDFDLINKPESTSFSVRDYGIGIPAEDQEKIFELFHRAQNVGNISGTGLGMSVVLRSTKLHKGTLELNSKVNNGTTIKVTLPNKQNTQVL